MRNFIQRILNKLPKYKYGVWYNYHIHNRKEYPIVFDSNGEYIDCEVGVKLIMGKTKRNENIYYEVVSYKYGRQGDWLYDSDRINCKMKFSHIEPKILN